MKKTFLLLTTGFIFLFASSQDEFDPATTIGLFAGAMNYQGDLKPNSFTLQHSNLVLSLNIRKPLNRWVSLKTGVLIGKVEAADKYNREDLKFRNLSFASGIKEVYGVIEVDFLDITTKKFTPYIYGGGAAFHFNSYADYEGEKVYLKPLSTEGQGLPDYPDWKEYKLTQFTLAFGGGLRFAVSNCTSLSLEFSQRKTFTDYLDDVSTNYIDQNKLLAAKGQRAVDVAYRTDEFNGSPYPPDGEQRGTPTEADWYYFVGINAEIKLNCLKNKFSGLMKQSGRSPRYTKCPKFF